MALTGEVPTPRGDGEGPTFHDLRLLPESLTPVRGEGALVLETLGAMAALCPEDDEDLYTTVFLHHNAL